MGRIPAKSNPKKLFPFLNDLPSARLRADVTTSLADRYLIEVKRFDKKGKPLVSWFYTPNALAIERQNPELGKEL